MDRLVIVRYRLNENFKDAELVIGTNALVKDWRAFESRVEGFEEFIRTRHNPEGIVDFQEYDNVHQTVIFDSNESFNKKLLLTNTRDSLLTMSVNEVNLTAKDFGIITIKKRKEFLIDLIMKEQEIMKEKKLKVPKVSENLEPNKETVETLAENSQEEKKKKFNFNF